MIQYTKAPAAFILADMGEEYFLHFSDIVQADQSRTVSVGGRVSFLPIKRENNNWAIAAEIL